MDKIRGNFTTQANKDFPLDCETLEQLQALSEMTAVLGNMGGDRIVVSGCAASGDGTRREEGYVFLRTKDHPEGEVLRWEGGPTTSGMYVRQEAIGVTANNVEYPQAYTRRTLAPGIGAENYRWPDFAGIRSIRDLMADNAALRAEVAALQPAPLGVVEMWAGRDVPAGYVLCDGRTLSQAEYPELYGALGTTFNTAVSAGGVRYTTPAGQFRVPDLRGRFVVGQHDSDADYAATGIGGGRKTVALTLEQLPRHAHDVKDYYHAESQKKVRGNYDNLNVNDRIGSGGSDYDNEYLQWIMHSTEENGGGAAHENRPPYYA